MGANLQIVSRPRARAAVPIDASRGTKRLFLSHDVIQHLGIARPYRNTEITQPELPLLYAVNTVSVDDIGTVDPVELLDRQNSLGFGHGEAGKNLSTGGNELHIIPGALYEQDVRQ